MIGQTWLWVVLVSTGISIVLVVLFIQIVFEIWEFLFGVVHL